MLWGFCEDASSSHEFHVQTCIYHITAISDCALPSVQYVLKSASFEDHHHICNFLHRIPLIESSSLHQSHNKLHNPHSSPSPSPLKDFHTLRPIPHPASPKVRMSIADPTQPPIPRNDPLIRAHGRSRIEHTFRVKLRLDRSKTVVIASVEGVLLVLLLEIGLERKKKSQFGLSTMDG